MRLKFLIGLAVAGVCLYFAFRGISFGAIWQTLKSANIYWIFLGLIVYSMGYIVRTVRWQILMRPIITVSSWELLAPLFIGFFANNILPLRMGEFARAHFTGNRFRISRTASLGTILVERLWDTLSFLTTFIAVALFFPFPSAVEKGAMALGSACFLVVGALFIISWHQARFHQTVAALPVPPAVKKRINEFIQNFIHGVSSMKRLKDVLSTLVLSLVVWTCEGSFLYLMARSLHIPMGYPQSFFLLFFMGLSATLPQAPGYVGTVEFFGVKALLLLGIPKDPALTMILAIHGTQFAFIMIAGTWAMVHEGLTFKTLVSTGPAQAPNP